MNKRPPTPLPALLLWRRVTRFSAVICLAGIAIGLTAWAITGNGRAMFIAVPGLLILGTSLTHRFLVIQRLFLVGAFTSFGWVLGRPLIGLLAGAAWLVFAWYRGRTMPDDLTADSLTELPGFTVGTRAEAFVQEYLDLGYQPAGAYGFPAMGNLIVASVMVGPDRDRYATVTDAVLTVTSQFDDRTLVTRNSANSRLAPHVLDNPIYGAEPAELDRRHADALALLAGAGEPEGLTADSVTALAVRNEQRNIAWIRTQKSPMLPGGGKGSGPLPENPSAATLIASWLAGDDSTESTSPGP